MCFLPDIRDKAIINMALSNSKKCYFLKYSRRKISKWEMHVNRRIPIIKRRIQQKKVLLGLDDVDKLEQYEETCINYYFAD